MGDAMQNRSEATYGVRGLMCNRCLGAAMEELHELPGVSAFDVEFVPYGVSTVRIVPGDAVSPDLLKAAMDRRGFRVVRRGPRNA